MFIELVDEGSKAQYAKQFDEFLEQERERLREIEQRKKSQVQL